MRPSPACRLSSYRSDAGSCEVQAETYPSSQSLNFTRERLVRIKIVIAGVPPGCAEIGEEAVCIGVIEASDLAFGRPMHQWYMVWHEDNHDDPARTWLRNEVLGICAVLKASDQKAS